MIASVTFYKSTGLSPGNSMESTAMVQAAFYDKALSVPECALKQNKGLVTVRVQMKYSESEKVDYCIIGRVAYYVVGVDMPNDDVAIFTLTCDYITTVGIDNIEVLGGWCIRRHVNDDTLFSNTINEPFTPTENMVLESGGIVEKGSTVLSKDLNVVIATVDLSISGEEAKKYATPYFINPSLAEDLGSKVGLFTPRINNLDVFTWYKMDVMNQDNTISTKQTTVPYTAAFDLDTDAVQSEIAQMYALGLDNVILQSYIIPSEFVDNILYAPTSRIPQWALNIFGVALRQPNCAIDAIGSNFTIKQSSLKPKFSDNYKNNKVFTGQFQRYDILSLTSGDEMQFEPEDIINPEGNIFWRICADLRWNGCPYVFPMNYKDNINVNYIGMIKGAQWMTSPIKQIGESGYLAGRIDRVQGIIGNTAANIFNDSLSWKMNGHMNMPQVSGYIGTPSGYDPEQKNAVLHAAQGVESMLGELASNTIGTGYLEANVPRIPFNQTPTLQNYLGNKFYEYRIRMSDSDMRRFDEFLTQFGYAVNEKLTSDCFVGREHFNYVKAESVDVRLNSISDMNYVGGVKSSLERGIRIWHKAPTVSAMSDNPIKA